MADWSKAPLVFVRRPLCPDPSCGAEKYHRIKTWPRESDGSQTKLVVCKRCSRPYKIVMENPETGESELAPCKLTT